MFILLVFFVLEASAFGCKQTLFKVSLNHDFQNSNAVFKTEHRKNLLACSVFCAQNDACRAASFNVNSKICSLSSSCEVNSVVTTGINVIQNCPADCSDLPPGAQNGVYRIYPMVNGVPYQTAVFCDMDGGGWTLIQRRSLSSNVDFSRTFVEYKNGFGDKLTDHWLGNELLHHILSNRQYRLRFDLEDKTGNVRYAEYDSFFVGDEASDFILSISGYSGTAGDSLNNPYCNGGAGNPNHVVNGMKFSAFDRDNDKCPDCNCSINSGWWMKWCSCGSVNSLEWVTMTRNGLKSAVMKIRN